MLVSPGRVALALDLVAIADQSELGAGKGVANSADKLSCRVPVAVLEDIEELLNFGWS